MIASIAMQHGLQLSATEDRIRDEGYEFVHAQGWASGEVYRNGSLGFACRSIAEARTILTLLTRNNSFPAAYFDLDEETPSGSYSIELDDERAIRLFVRYGRV